MDNKTINKQIRGISNRGSLLLIIFFAVTVLVSLLMGFLSYTGGYGSLWQNGRFTFTLTTVGLCFLLYPLLLLVYYKCLNRKNGLRLREAFGKSRRSKGWLFKWTVISIGCSQLVSIIFNFFYEYEGKPFLPSQIEKLLSKNDLYTWIVFALYTVVLAPIFEELLFRATIYRNNAPMGQLFAAVVTGITFGLWHTNISQTIFAAIMGIFLCLIYAKTKSIVTVMLVHSINNLISFLLTFIKIQLGSILSAGDKEFMIQAMFHTQTVKAVFLTVIILVVFLACIIGPILLAVQIVKKRKGLGLSKGIFPYSAPKKALVYFSAPLTVIAFALMIALTFFSA